MSTQRKAHLRKTALDIASDAASNYAYYDRKESDFSRKDLEEAIDTGAVTYDEIAAVFRKGLEG